MNGPQPSRRIGRSVVALLAGIFAGVALSLGTDIVLHAVGVFPPWGEPVSDPPLLLATAYRVVYGVLSSYITARLAPGKPMQHALLLGVLGLLASAAGAVATWNKGPAFGAHWYPLALIVTALPCAWAGGAIRVAQLRVISQKEVIGRQA